MNTRFRDHQDGLNPIQKAVGQNFDSLADKAGEDVALTYLARVQGAKINNSAMAKILGDVHLINDYGAGGAKGVPYTIDPDGVTLRVGVPHGNWKKHLATDTRQKYTLPVNIAGL